MSSTQYTKAEKIALQCLRACYREFGIVAGNHHFTDYWARDGYFAGFGVLAIGDTKIVQKMIKLFFSHQLDSGILPYRVMNGPMLSLNKYLGHPTFYTSPRPTYRLRGIGPYVLDGTTLSVLFAAILQEQKFLPQIKLALEYLVTREKNDLLWDGVMSEWLDSVWKWGNLLYSNVIYWYMYAQLAKWMESHDKEWSRQLYAKSTQIATSLRSQLWNGKYFADSYDYKRQDYFYPFGNCLAITWGLTTAAETTAILNKCKSHLINFGLETNAPPYPFWRVDPLHHLVGMGDYQNHGILWWQPVLSYLIALIHTHRHKEAQTLLSAVAGKITRDNNIYEVYERNGESLNRFNYKAERPFAWASGMFLLALAYNKAHANT